MWNLSLVIRPRWADRCVAVAALLVGAGPAWAQAGSGGGSLTDVPGIRVGHHTLAERPTGCTVVPAPEGTVGGVDVRGGAPGTRETDLLDPVNTVEIVNAVVLAGGSAFGLDAASGVVRYLEEQGIGYAVGPVVRVPIVTAAILFDLGVGGDWTVRPGPECGYQAATGATASAIESGSVGAGAGATVGKLAGMGRAMKGGVGSASLTLPSGLVVAALVAVNAVGDVIDPATGQVVAGVRSEDGTTLADARVLLRAGSPQGGSAGQNTTIGVVATNARLTKAEATRVALMAQDGYARAIYPVHTPGDGDITFSLATGTLAEDGRVTTGQVGALAAEVVAAAILDAVRSASPLPGLPAAADLQQQPDPQTPSAGRPDPLEHASAPISRGSATPSRDLPSPPARPDPFEHPGAPAPAPTPPTPTPAAPTTPPAPAPRP